MHFLFPLFLAFLQSAGVRAGEIIGGREAKPHSRPYMANLKYWDEKGRECRCGAFLVREDFLLTAAHCWGSKMSILLGAHNIQKPEKTQQRIPVLKTIPHQLYNNQTIKNDIMLVKGDSGGPLVCDRVAQGIVSFGWRNGKNPRVYTRISSFLPWIKKTMNSHEY
ncbi:granzyme B-like [Trichosurus vulpecula]|uniref:granzyme B-like n=1 Tax=Trichosurus vulpecula TaxID=9337 RepID=UPI00186B0A5A|nr:granzyme B-like [Trichosurus vulpecula]